MDFGVLDFRLRSPPVCELPLLMPSADRGDRQIQIHPGRSKSIHLVDLRPESARWIPNPPGQWISFSNENIITRVRKAIESTTSLAIQTRGEQGGGEPFWGIYRIIENTYFRIRDHIRIRIASVIE